MPKTTQETGGRSGRAAGMNRFRVQTIAFIILYTLIVYVALFYQAQRLLNDSLRAQAESYYKLVYHTREWNANHGGVWVFKAEGIDTNPYLEELGVSADLKTDSGAELTLRNPAAMIDGISDLTQQASGVTFRMTSDKPINPANAPDAWEREGLARFSKGETDFAEHFERDLHPPVYRYMQPLSVEESCLVCHAVQGYMVGDIRGAIVITIPIDGMLDQLRNIRTLLFGLAIATLAISLTAAQYALNRLEGRVKNANARLARIAVTDDLTGVANRRATYARLSDEFARSKRTQQPLSVVLLDIDYFKRVNDSYGHGVGDSVLKETSHRMQNTVREYDVFGRVGGEEFLAIAPDTNAEDALRLAERLVRNVRVEPVIVGDVALFVTASAGSATMGVEDERPDDLIARADVALYNAKRLGRDRAASADET